jgi:hypothetical protein
LFKARQDDYGERRHINEIALYGDIDDQPGATAPVFAGLLSAAFLFAGIGAIHRAALRLTTDVHAG